MTGFKWQAAAWPCGILAALVAVGVYACDTPVYQYALAVWPPDAYEMVVVHRGDAGEVPALAALRDAASETANLAVREVDLYESKGSYGPLLEEQPPRSWPWLYVRFPVRNGARQTVWAGPLADDTVAAWLDSPARREIVKLLLAGRAGVWLFLESGDRRKDEAAYALLTRELARLERTIRLPDEYAGPAGGLSFTVMRVARDDPRERELTAMLTASEPDLVERAHEPMVFPIYGRGLILYALIGTGINETTLAEAAEFLTGPCSCEVKSDNPGLEMLLSADWEGDLMAGAGMADFLERADQADVLLAKADERAPESEAPTTDDGPGWLAMCRTCPIVSLGCNPLGILFLAAAGVLSFVALRMLRRGRGGR